MFEADLSASWLKLQRILDFLSLRNLLSNELFFTFYYFATALFLFSKYMINMIQLGEETGRLEEVLNSLSKYYDREDEIASGIKSAVAYPLVLSAVMIAVIVVMIAKVLPVFSQIYAELGSELTGTAAVLMKLSEYINRYLLIIIAVMLFAALVLFIFFKTRFGK